MSITTSLKLIMMMFLEYFVWGAWYVTMGTYMGEHFNDPGIDRVIGYSYSALAFATIISPFFIGMVADRFFAAQKIMGILHLGGALLLYLTTKVTSGTVFPIIILLYSLCTCPLLLCLTALLSGK